MNEKYILFWNEHFNSLTETKERKQEIVLSSGKYLLYFLAQDIIRDKNINLWKIYSLGFFYLWGLEGSKDSCLSWHIYLKFYTSALL